MQKFYFKAVTQGGKQLTGYIDAENEEVAHDKLVEAKMAVLDMEPYEEEKHKEVKVKGLNEFEYQARNEKDHKLFKGKIQATSDYEAYKKLRVEYKLEVDYVIPIEVPEEEKEALRLQGVTDDFEDKVLSEIKKIEKKNKKRESKKKGISDEEALDRVLKERNESLQFYQKKIDEIIQEMVPLLEKNERFIKREKKKEIEDNLNLLARLKRSNSLDHLKSLVEKALDGIADEKIFLEEVEFENLSEEEKESIKEMQGTSVRMKEGIEKALMDAQLQLGGMSPDEIKGKLKDLDLPQKIFRFFYLVHFNLLLFLFIFWFGYAFLWKIVFSKSAEVGRAYLFSENLFLLGGVSFFFVVLFGVEFWGNKYSLKSLGIKSLIHSCFVLFFVLLFPFFFFWTY